VYDTPTWPWGGRKDRARTPGLWIATNVLPTTGGHPFYQRLNQMLDRHGFDEFVEAQCAPFYAAKLRRPSLTPGTSNSTSFALPWKNDPCGNIVASRSRDVWSAMSGRPKLPKIGEEMRGDGARC
jgi:hypothetical protein